MSTTDHKRAFRAPTDNDGGFYVHPNSLDDITLSNGTPGLQRIVATNQASAIGPYIVRGLNIVGSTIQAGEAVFKSGGIVSAVATALSGSGNYLYFNNDGTFTRSAAVTKSDTSLLIDYYDTSWHCTKEDTGVITLGAKDVKVLGDVNATTGTITTGHITTLDADMNTNGKKITGLPAPASATDPLRLAQNQYGLMDFILSWVYSGGSGRGISRDNAHGLVTNSDPTYTVSVQYTIHVPLDFKNGGTHTTYCDNAINFWFIFDADILKYTGTSSTLASALNSAECLPGRTLVGYCNLGAGAIGHIPWAKYEKVL